MGLSYRQRVIFGAVSERSKRGLLPHTRNCSKAPDIMNTPIEWLVDCARHRCRKRAHITMRRDIAALGRDDACSGTDACVHAARSGRCACETWKRASRG